MGKMQKQIQISPHNILDEAPVCEPFHNQSYLKITSINYRTICQVHFPWCFNSSNLTFIDTYFSTLIFAKILIQNVTLGINFTGGKKLRENKKSSFKSLASSHMCYVYVVTTEGTDPDRGHRFASDQNLSTPLMYRIFLNVKACRCYIPYDNI